MNEPYSKAWDIKFNKMLDLNEFEIKSQFNASLGGEEIWIENHPYASFNYKGSVRPSRLTIAKAYRKLMKATKGMTVREYLVYKELHS